jgi:hypothetical protein
MVQSSAFAWKNQMQDHLEDLGIEGWITYELILKKQDGRYGLD